MHGKLISGASQSRYRGLTLTEVLVSLAILAAAMVPILKGLTQAHLTSRILEQQSISWMEAQSQIETLRAMSLAQWDQSWARSNLSLGSGYYCTISDSGPGADLRTVQVQAGFDEDGDSRLDTGEISADLSTLIARCD